MKEKEIVEELLEYFNKELDEARGGTSPFAEEEVEVILLALTDYEAIEREV